MVARQPQFSPKQVAAAMRVSESSVKRWCDSGALPVIKTLGGHRRITMGALQIFLETSQKPLLHPETLGLPKLPPQRAHQIGGSEHPRNQAFRNALAEGKHRTCRKLLLQMIDEGSSRSEAAETLITDAMRGFGEAWDRKELDVYQERRGCDIAMRLIYELCGSITTPDENAPVAIGGAPEGDPYQLCSALAELTLREDGWNATNLGSGLPMESFLQATYDYDPQLVWMSVSVVEDPSEFVVAHNQFADSLGENVPLLVGGRALTDQLRPRLRYTAHCDSLRSLLTLAAIMRAHHLR